MIFDQNLKDFEFLSTQETEANHHESHDGTRGESNRQTVVQRSESARDTGAGITLRNNILIQILELLVQNLLFSFEKSMSSNHQ